MMCKRRTSSSILISWRRMLGSIVRRRAVHSTFLACHQRRMKAIITINRGSVKLPPHCCTNGLLYAASDAILVEQQEQ
eukprot:scaffold8184_cov164-Skeletonema_marinoi.AAC.5